MADQDWNTITFKKKAPSAKDSKAVTQAQRTGAAVDTTKKAFGGSNKKPATGGQDARRLESDILKGIDEEPDKLAPKTVGPKVGRAIQTARVAKGLTQAQLAQKINQKATVVNELEQGKALFNNQILGNLERHLGVKLRGDQALIGTPLEPKTPKAN
jgi:putative transcription factor